jgi:hypothetical protein
LGPDRGGSTTDQCFADGGEMLAEKMRQEDAYEKAMNQFLSLKHHGNHCLNCDAGNTQKATNDTEDRDTQAGANLPKSL